MQLKKKDRAFLSPPKIVQSEKQEHKLLVLRVVIVRCFISLEVTSLPSGATSYAPCFLMRVPQYFARSSANCAVQFSGHRRIYNSQLKPTSQAWSRFWETVHYFSRTRIWTGEAIRVGWGEISMAKKWNSHLFRCRRLLRSRCRSDVKEGFYFRCGFQAFVGKWHNVKNNGREPAGNGNRPCRKTDDFCNSRNKKM